jgi:hypothetical protein
MSRNRIARREARLVVTIHELTADRSSAAIDDVLAIDFLLQHPAALRNFISLDEPPWPSASHPTPAEIDSSEEVFLRWKRSTVFRTLAPLLGRLIGRGLVTRPLPAGLALTRRGTKTSAVLSSALGTDERDRLATAVSMFLHDADAAHDRLRSAINEQTT